MPRKKVKAHKNIVETKVFRLIERTNFGSERNRLQQKPPSKVMELDAFLFFNVRAVQ